MSLLNKSLLIKIIITSILVLGIATYTYYYSTTSREYLVVPIFNGELGDSYLIIDEDGELLPTQLQSYIGYTFEGLYTDQNMTKEYSYNLSLKQTLFAKYIANDYYFNFVSLTQSDDEIKDIFLGKFTIVVTTTNQQTYLGRMPYVTYDDDGNEIIIDYPLINITNDCNLNSEEYIVKAVMLPNTFNDEPYFLTSEGRLLGYPANINKPTNVNSDAYYSNFLVEVGFGVTFTDILSPGSLSNNVFLLGLTTNNKVYGYSAYYLDGSLQEFGKTTFDFTDSFKSILPLNSNIVSLANSEIGSNSIIIKDDNSNYYTIRSSDFLEFNNNYTSIPISSLYDDFGAIENIDFYDSYSSISITSEGYILKYNDILAPTTIIQVDPTNDNETIKEAVGGDTQLLVLTNNNKTYFYQSTSFSEDTFTPYNGDLNTTDYSFDPYLDLQPDEYVTDIFSKFSTNISSVNSNSLLVVTTNQFRVLSSGDYLVGRTINNTLITDNRQIVDISNLLNLEVDENIINIQKIGYRVVFTTNFNNIIFLNGFSYLEDYFYDNQKMSTKIISEKLYNKETIKMLYKVSMDYNEFIDIEREGYVVEGLYSDYKFTIKFDENSILEFISQVSQYSTNIEDKYIRWIEN